MKMYNLKPKNSLNGIVAGALLVAAGTQYIPMAVPVAQASPAKTAAFSDPAFEQVWARTDKPVEEGRVARSWTWGPQGFNAAYEPYTEGPGGQHLVTYFDKSRMEINAPAADRNAQWYVTDGLLVVDMLAGKIQTGNKSFAPFHPNNAPVAGDASSPNAPTYATLARVASLNSDNRAANRTGQAVSEGLGRNGNIGAVQNLSGYAKYATYDATLGHNIPDVFWSYLNSRGPVYRNGSYTDDMVVDWLFALGYPVTEPYWIQIKAGGQDRWVLMQAFQRRILTYSPDNAPGWKVEMANVGRAYFDWRYTSQPAPAPAPTNTPAPVAVAGISIDPPQGATGNIVTVAGKNFPANTNATILVENSAAGYLRNLGLVGTNSSGAFTVKIAVPADAARLGEVKISTVVGSIKATQTYKLNYDPSITVTPGGSVGSGGTVRVQGASFPAHVLAQIGVIFTGGKVEWITKASTNDVGKFDVAFNLGPRATNSQFTVVVTAEGNYKVTSPKLTISPAPPPTPAPVERKITVNPTVLAVGQAATITGSGWETNTRVQIGLGYAGVQEWLGNTLADAAGNLTFSFVLGNRWQNAGQMTLFAVSPDGKVAITKLSVPTAGRIVPSGLDVPISSYQHGATPPLFKIRALGWQPGRAVTVSVFSADGTLNVPVASGAVKPDGMLALNFQAAAPWYGRGDLGVRVTGADGTQLSVRYLPLLGIVQAANKSYDVSARNLPPNAPVEVVVHLDGKGDQVVGSGISGSDGLATLNVVLPRIPSNNSNDVEVRTKDGQYSAIFDF